MKIQYVDLTDNGDGECDSRKIAAVFKSAILTFPLIQSMFKNS